jgi:quinoprotein dehydrogenase-associated probable ABC transporter substrate-binding protein
MTKPRLTLVLAAIAAAAVAAAALLPSVLLSQPAASQAASAVPGAADGVLRVCADPSNMPQSNSRGEGYENRIAQVLARDLKRKVEYTFFPQRLGFVRNTLRARDSATQQYKCDLIMGVPHGYQLTATTQPYMRSTYVLLLGHRTDLARLTSAQDVLQLPADKLRSLRIGLFAQTPGADWALRHGLMEHAQLYPAQSGDPAETAASLAGRDLASGQIDAAILWGPIAGYLVRHADAGVPLAMVPFKPEDGIKLDYEISMGVRQGENDWRDALDGWISTHREEIEQILGSFQVPLLPVGAPHS